MLMMVNLSVRVSESDSGATNVYDEDTKLEIFYVAKNKLVS